MLVSAQTKILLWMVEACVKRNHHMMPEAGGGLRGRGLYGKKSRKKPFIVFQRHALNDTVCTDFVSQTSPTFSGYLHPGKQAPTHEVLGRQATYTTLWMESTIPAHFDLQVFQLWIILLISTILEPGDASMNMEDHGLHRAVIYDLVDGEQWVRKQSWVLVSTMKKKEAREWQAVVISINLML